MVLWRKFRNGFIWILSTISSWVISIWDLVRDPWLDSQPDPELKSFVDDRVKWYATARSQNYGPAVSRMFTAIMHLCEEFEERSDPKEEVIRVINEWTEDGLFFSKATANSDMEEFTRVLYRLRSINESSDEKSIHQDGIRSNLNSAWHDWHFDSAQATETPKPPTPEETLKILRAIINRNPNHPEPLFYLGLIQFGASKFEAALKTINRCESVLKKVTENSSTNQPLSGIGGTLNLLPNQRKVYDHIGIQSPTISDLLLWSGKIRMRCEEWKEALKRLRKAKNLTPDRPSIYLNIGEIHKSNRKYTAAHENYRKVLSKETRENEAKLNYVMLSLLLGQYDEAIDILLHKEVRLPLARLKPGRIKPVEETPESDIHDLREPLKSTA